MNRYNHGLRHSESPHATSELEHNSPKVNLLGIILQREVTGAFFLCDKSIDVTKHLIGYVRKFYHTPDQKR